MWRQVDGGRNATCVEGILCTKRVVSRSNLVHLVEDEHIAHLDVSEPWHSDKVAFGDEVGASGYRGDGIVVGLRLEQAKRLCV